MKEDLNKIFPDKGPWTRNCIFLARAGSDAYGTRTGMSDTDYRGVFLAERDHILGLDNVEAYCIQEPVDLHVFELRRFVRLCLKGSPLQLEMLFYPEDVILWETEEWAALREIRRKFLGKHLKKTLGGFAQGDIRRIEGGSTKKCGAKGKALIEAHGYNTKHAANAYRLLVVAETLFTTGELAVRLSPEQREEAIAIKNGKYTKDEFLSWMRDRDEKVFQLAADSDLPEGPDRSAAHTEVMDLYWKHLLYGPQKKEKA